MKDGCEEDEQNVNPFSANEAEVIQRAISQEYNGDQQDVVRTLCRCVSENQGETPLNRKCVDRLHLQVETEEINSVLELFQTRSMTGTKKIIWTAAMVAEDRVQHNRKNKQDLKKHSGKEEFARNKAKRKFRTN